MAQSKEVAAMRIRLIRRGYHDVRIDRADDGGYLVQALEPLAGIGVQLQVAEDEVKFVGRW